MSLSNKTEAALLSHEDRELVASSHHPAIGGHSHEELHELRKRLRTMRDRERTLLRQKQREARGKAEARGSGFPGLVDHPARRKQVFAQALKRVNSEVSRLRKIEAREALTTSARRALAMRKAGERHARPENTPSPDHGLNPITNPKGRDHIPGGQVGSVSQATKRAQAISDNR